MSDDTTESTHPPPRKSCIRCGAKLGERALGVCTECGALNQSYATQHEPMPEVFRSDGTPRCLRPRYFRLIIALVDALVAACIFAICSWFLRDSIMRYYSLLLSVSIAGGVLIGQWVSHQVVGRHLIRLRNHLVLSDFRVCLRCGYRLDGLPDAHRCPECGVAYQRDELRALWIRCLKQSKHIQLSSEEIIGAIRKHAALYRDRTTCIRCGDPLSDGPSRECTECGAANSLELSENEWHELM